MIVEFIVVYVEYQFHCEQYRFDPNPRWFSFLEETHRKDLPAISLTS